MNYFENSVLLSHAGCSDGSACAILFRLLGGKKNNIIFSNPANTEVDDHVKSFLEEDTDKTLIIADASVSEELAKDINNSLHNRSRVILFDHHKTAYSLAKYKDWCNISTDNSRCGSALFFDWLCDIFTSDLDYQTCLYQLMRYDDLITYVDDHDRWIHKHSETKDISALHTFLGQSMFIERFLSNPSCSLTKEEQYALKIEGERLKNYCKKVNEEVVINICEQNNNKYKVGFVVCEKNQSDVGHYILENRLIDMVVLISNKSISLRSSDKSSIDSSAIAKKFGGGGHKNASGCRIDNVLGSSIVDLVMKNFKI